MNMTPIYQSEGSWVIRGSFDISAAAAVVPITIVGGTKTMRGDNMSVTKTAGTGKYTVVLKGTAGLKMVEILDFAASLGLGTPAGAFNARIDSITQNTSTDDISIIIGTYDNTALGPVAANSTAAISIAFRIDIRVRKMDAQI